MALGMGKHPRALLYPATMPYNASAHHTVPVTACGAVLRRASELCLRRPAGFRVGPSLLVALAAGIKRSGRTMAAYM